MYTVSLEEKCRIISRGKRLRNFLRLEHESFFKLGISFTSLKLKSREIADDGKKLYLDWYWIRKKEKKRKSVRERKIVLLSVETISFLFKRDFQDFILRNELSNEKKKFVRFEIVLKILNQ